MALEISSKIIDRIGSKLKTYQAAALSLQTKGVSEADTVTLVKDILSDCFGFGKYHELTSEQQIRGRYCDLAVKIGNRIQYLIEVKAAGVALNASHMREIVTYGANEGIEWVVLTNAVEWQLHRIKFAQPIDHELVTSFNFSTVSTKNEDDVKKMFLLCREGNTLNAMYEFHQHTQILNQYTIAQILQMESIIGAIRKEFNKLFPDIKIDNQHIADFLKNDVLKREVIEGDKAKEMQQKLKRIMTKMVKQLVQKSEVTEQEKVDSDASK